MLPELQKRRWPQSPAPWSHSRRRRIWRRHWRRWRKEKDIAAMKVAPKKRGRKAAAVAAPNKEEEETEKKPVAKRGRKALASVEEKREEEAPELAVPEPEVSSSTR